MDISMYLADKEGIGFQQNTETGINRIVTPHKEDEQFFWRKCAEIFDRQKIYLAEREKTEEEIAIVSHILLHMKEFVKRYGGTHVHYQPKHIHVINPQKLSRDDWVKMRKRGLLDGQFVAILQAVVLILYRRDDLITFANVVAHELFHANAFQSLQIVWEDDDKKIMTIFERRSGMSISSPGHMRNENQYFRWLNEAVTQELTERFSLEHLRDLDVLEKPMWLREHFLPHIEKKKLFLYGYCREKLVKGHSFTNYGIAESYPDERKKLNHILDDIVAKMGDRFPTTEDAFDLFARSYFDGNILPVARVIDTVYGKGSFRDMAMCMYEKTSFEKELLRLHIDS